MPCYISCALATMFVIASIYTTNACQTNQTIQQYQSQLPSQLQNIYKQITQERQKIYYYGYALGLVLSIVIIFYKTQNRISMTNGTMVCTIIAVSFITNYFYYMLSPKSTYMLQHINSPDQTRAWLAMYKAMQYYWHSGLALGIIATTFLALAFRC